MEEKVTLGAEHDVALHRTLVGVLREMGAEIGPTTWGVAGSQELSMWEAGVQGRRLKIEA